MFRNHYRLQILNNKFFKLLLVIVIIIIGISARLFPVSSFTETNQKTTKNNTVINLDSSSFEIYSALVMDFYNNLNEGDYDRAFENTLEIDWKKDIYFDKNKNVEGNSMAGIKNKEDLIYRAINDLGKNGEKLSIYDTKIINIVRINYNHDYNNLQDVKIIRHISEFREIDSSYVVSVEGQIYSSFCHHSKWHKDLVLIKFKDDEKIRILLNGAKNMVGNSSIEWFINRIVGEYIKI